MNLYLDTHLDNIVVILFNEEKIIKEKIITDKKQNSTMIMPIIKELLKNDKPNSIVVCNGPGSFTGVRLGVTIAKTLAYTLNIPIRTITSLECMALSTKTKERIVAFNDKNGYYVGIFDENIRLTDNYVYLSNKEFSEFSNKHNVITDIELDYLSIFKYVLTKKELNPHEVNPLYVKKLDVEK